RKISPRRCRATCTRGANCANAHRDRRPTSLAVCLEESRALTSKCTACDATADLHQPFHLHEVGALDLARRQSFAALYPRRPRIGRGSVFDREIDTQRVVTANVDHRGARGNANRRAADAQDAGVLIPYFTRPEERQET